MTEPKAVGTHHEEPLLALRPPVEVGPGRWRLEPVGEIDMSNAAALATACVDLLGRSGVILELDLGGVSHLDSSGICAIVALLRALESRGGSLQVTSASGIVGRVIELSGLGPLLGGQTTS